MHTTGWSSAEQWWWCQQGDSSPQGSAESPTNPACGTAGKGYCGRVAAHSPTHSWPGHPRTRVCARHRIQRRQRAHGKGGDQGSGAAGGARVAVGSIPGIQLVAAGHHLQAWLRKQLIQQGQVEVACGEAQHSRAQRGAAQRSAAGQAPGWQIGRR